MRTAATCDCGTEIRGQGTEALVAAYFDHCRAEHPDWEISEQMVRNYLEALDRLTGPTERLERIGAIEVHPTAGARIEDVLTFFDHDVFADNPGWGSCYCMFHHVDASTWSERSSAQNRAELGERLRSGATTAMVASVDGRLAGWCNASLRSAYPAHRDGTAADDRTAAIVCFAVAPPYRGHGVAGHLLDRAVGHLRENGVQSVEAYPVRDPGAAAAAYHGTVGMFEAAGFEIASDDEQGIVMRRSIA